jgi:hypothetical protein
MKKTIHQPCMMQQFTNVMSTSDFEQERWTHAVPTPEGRTETAGKSCDEETRSRKRRRNAVEVTHAPDSSEPQAGKRRSESWHKIGSTDNGYRPAKQQ